MDQIYAAEYEYADGRWTTRVAPVLADCEALARVWQRAPPPVVAGNALGVVRRAACDRRGRARPRRDAERARAAASRGRTRGPTARAVDAALALPLYVRDKVAQTESRARGALARRSAARDRRCLPNSSRRAARTPPRSLSDERAD